MVYLIIRDDDLNYFSRVEDVEKVYENISFFPISFAVIPTVTDVSTVGNCPETRGNVTPMWIGDNKELISWIRGKIRNKQADVLLHGITHGYKIIDGERFAEMEWRNENNLMEEILEQKKRLESLLDYNITVFVAPSNKISKYGIDSVAKCNMNYSGIIPLSYKRSITARNLSSYAKRLLVRACYNLPYPGVLHYTDHLEINACGTLNYDYLVKMFNYCDKRNLPMAINVHYWIIRDHKEEFNDFFSFINYAMDHGACPTLMSSQFTTSK